MTIESIFYLTLGIAVTATEIALVSSYYRIKWQIMFYPLFLVVALGWLILGGSLLAPNPLLKVFILVALYFILCAFCGKFVSIFFFVSMCVIAGMNGFISIMLFEKNIPLSVLSNIILNVSVIYIIRILEIKLDLQPVIKKVVLLLFILGLVAFSILFYK